MLLVDGESPMAIKLPQGILGELEAIRKSGKTKTYDAPAVMEVAMREGYMNLLNWIREHRREYHQGRLEGFRPE